MYVWNVLHVDRWKYRTQKLRKKSPSAHHGTALSLQLRHALIIGKKLVKQQYFMQMSPEFGELRPTNGWDQLASFGYPSKFQQVSRLGLVTAATSLTGGQPNLARCLAVSWVGTLYTFLGAFAPWWNFARCKLHFGPSLAFSCIGSITARH